MCVVAREDIRIIWALLELLSEEVLWCQCVRGSVQGSERPPLICPRGGRGVALTLYCCSLSPGCYNTTDVNGEHVRRGVNDMPPPESLAAPSRCTPQTQPAQKRNYQYTVYVTTLQKGQVNENQTRQISKYEKMVTHLKSPLRVPLNPSSSSPHARLVCLCIDNIEQIKRIVDSRRLEALHHTSNINTRGRRRSRSLSFPAPAWRILPTCTRTDSL